MGSVEPNSSRSLKSAVPKSLFGFDVIDWIGQGAASAIYAVSHPATGQLYAMKHVLRKTEKDDRFIEQLDNEYEVGRQIKNPGLRRSIEVFHNRNFFRKVTEAGLLLELFDGMPLEVRVPSSRADLVSILIQSARALDALHHMGFIHCDLKPNNILVDQNFGAKVIDLGQACRSGTCKSRIQGTPDYIAPEQVKMQAVTSRTDVYNFGATMYWSLTQRKMPTLYTIKRSENSFLLGDNIPSPRDLNSGVPEMLSNLVMDCVRTTPVKRPSSMGDIAKRLEAIHHQLKARRSDDPSDSRFRSAGAGVPV